MYYAYYFNNHMYLRKVESKSPNTIRFLNHPSQFRFIEKYYPNNNLEFCSTRAIQVKEITDIETAMDNLEKVDLPPDQGGFRPVTSDEATALYLGTLKIDELSTSSPDVQDSVCAHPFMTSGGGFYLNDVITPFLVSLLAYIYDIRRLPSNDNDLFKFFKLDDYRVMEGLYKNTPVTEEIVKPSLVLFAWLNTPYKVFTKEQVSKTPFNFLFREFFAIKEDLSAIQGEEVALYKASIECSKRFIVYLRDLWLTGIGDVNKFNAAKFFKKEDEVEAFNSYVQSFYTGSHEPTIPLIGGDLIL